MCILMDDIYIYVLMCILMNDIYIHVLMCILMDVHAMPWVLAHTHT